MIYVDDLEYLGRRGRLWCHMWTDGADSELDEFAQRIGLKPEWKHISYGITGRFYHYDLLKSKREKALEQGAVYKPLRDYVKERLQG